MIIDREGKNQRTVSAEIYYLNGARFAAMDASPDDLGVARFASLEATEGPRFADPLSHGSVFGTATFGGDGGEELDAMTGRFGSAGRQVRTPRVRPGCDEWAYGVYTRADVETVAGTLSGPLYDNAPEQPGDAAVELTLSWWARRPASFRLSIPRSAWVGQAEERGAHRMLARWIEKLRPAGVVAAVDFPEPRKREHAALDERAGWSLRQQWRESLPLDEGALSWMTQSQDREDHALTDGVLTWRGVFDNTRLDESRFD